MFMPRATPCSRESQERVKPCSRESQESQAMFTRERFATGALFFNSPTWPCPRAACQIRSSVWGGAPPMSRLAGLELLGDVISLHFWEG